YCPTDKQRKMNDLWSSPNLALNLDAERHISFFVGLDAEESRPSAILAGDRNVYSPGAEASGNPLQPSWTSAVEGSIDARWDNTMHESQGYIVLTDASVQHTTTAQLQENIAASLNTSPSGN